MQQVIADATSSIKWGDISILAVLVAVIGYQWRQIAAGRVKRESEMVARIEKSIDNLSLTIKDSTTKFEKTTEKMWEHIGDLDKKLSNLIGHHEVNHKVKID